ncbi:hypothetical protein TWF128_005838 [Orbilia oligospora]|nr:hypothetical protein TWF128_005838 [Orbilia oligospora]
MKPHLCTTKDENSESGDNDALACKLLRSVGSTSLITYNHGSEGKLKRRDCSQEVMDHDRVSVVYAYKRHTYVSASLGNVRVLRVMDGPGRGMIISQEYFFKMNLAPPCPSAETRILDDLRKRRRR